MGCSGLPQTSLLSTNSPRKTAKAPAITSPELLLERIFVFDCLVEELLPLTKSFSVFSESKGSAFLRSNRLGIGGRVTTEW